MEIALSALSSVLPYILSSLAVVAGYFWIKNKGVQQEREKNQMAQAEAQRRVAERITQAVTQDAAIDQKVVKQIEEVVKSNTPTQPDRPDRFRF